MANLLLIPTSFEKEILQRHLSLEAKKNGWTIQLCGFGPVVAAARTAQLIASENPQQVLLLGIAGTFDQRLEVGSAWTFDQVRCDGVGIGLSCSLPASKAGWLQWDGPHPSPSIGDSLRIEPKLPNRSHCAGTLLTGCSCSATIQEAQQRSAEYPDAVAEDMEGFGVAAACHLAAKPLKIVRGISNQTGDRNVADWQTERALQSAATLAIRFLSGNDNY